jgi:hypothetical protein
MKKPQPANFAGANAEVDKARARIAKRLTTMFLPASRLEQRLPKPATRCPTCGYWVQGGCSTCASSTEST